MGGGVTWAVPVFRCGFFVLDSPNGTQYNSGVKVFLVLLILNKPVPTLPTPLALRCS